MTDVGFLRRIKGDRSPAVPVPNGEIPLSRRAAQVAEQMEGLENERDDALARALDWEQRAKVAEAHLAEARKTTAEQITVLTRRIAQLEHDNDDTRSLTTIKSSAS